MASARRCRADWRARNGSVATPTTPLPLHPAFASVKPAVAALLRAEAASALLERQLCPHSTPSGAALDRRLRQLGVATRPDRQLVSAALHSAWCSGTLPPPPPPPPLPTPTQVLTEARRLLGERSLPSPLTEDAAMSLEEAGLPWQQIALLQGGCLPRMVGDASAHGPKCKDERRVAFWSDQMGERGTEGKGSVQRALLS